MSWLKLTVLWAVTVLLPDTNASAAAAIRTNVTATTGHVTRTFAVFTTTASYFLRTDRNRARDLSVKHTPCMWHSSLVYNFLLWFGKKLLKSQTSPKRHGNAGLRVYYIPRA